MFNIPVHILSRSNDRITRLPASVPIDKLVVVKSLLDIIPLHEVDSSELLPFAPQTLLTFEDGRKLAVAEPVEEINAYLDAYRDIEGFFTAARLSIAEADAIAEKNFEPMGVVIPLFPRTTCDTSEASTPA